VTETPSVRARVDELILVCKGLALETTVLARRLEASRVQTAYVSEIAKDLLESVNKLSADPTLPNPLNGPADGPQAADRRS
jgi:hypothetical protein